MNLGFPDMVYSFILFERTNTKGIVKTRSRGKSFLFFLSQVRSCRLVRVVGRGKPWANGTIALPMCVVPADAVTVLWGQLKCVRA